MCFKCGICSIIMPLLIFLLLVVFVFIVIIGYGSSIDKSILSAIAKNGDNTEIGNAIIKFSENAIVYGNSISHQENSSEIRINRNGIYQISYQVYGVNETNGTFNFNIVIILNGTALNNTLNSSPVLREDVNNRMTLTSTIILELNAGDIVQLGAVSLEDISYTNARIDIEKIK